LVAVLSQGAEALAVVHTVHFRQAQTSGSSEVVADSPDETDVHLGSCQTPSGWWLTHQGQDYPLLMSTNHPGILKSHVAVKSSLH